MSPVLPGDGASLGQRRLAAAADNVDNRGRKASIVTIGAEGCAGGVKKAGRKDRLRAGRQAKAAVQAGRTSASGCRQGALIIAV